VWKVFSFRGEKVTLKSDARFGELALDAEAIRVTGDDALTFAKHEVQAIRIVTVPVAVPAICMKTNDDTIIVGREWFHITRYMVFARFLGDMRKAMLDFSKP